MEYGRFFINLWLKTLLQSGDDLVDAKPAGT